MANYGGPIGSSPISGAPLSSEVEASGGATYDEVAAGGVLANGISFVGLTLSNVATGGVLANGISTIVITVNIVAAGGAMSSRTSDRFLSTWNTSNTSAGSSTSTQIKLPLVNGGTYNFIVNWGDGTTDTITTWNQAEVTHTYGAGGAKTIEITGTCIGWRFNNTGDRLKILTISNWGTLRLGNTGGYFHGCTNLTSIGKFLDTTGTTDFSYAWAYCNGLTSFSAINTSSGTDFTYAWIQCYSLDSFPAIDTSSGLNFTYAWAYCDGLTSFAAINTSSGTDFNHAWAYCSSLSSFPAIDTSNGINFSSTWDNCYTLTSFPAIDTSSGTNFNRTWSECGSLTSFPTIDTSIGTDFTFAWSGCLYLTSFPLIDMSSGTIFDSAWTYCNGLTEFPTGFGSTMGAMTNGSDMLFGVTFTTVAYSRLLVEIRTVNANTSVNFHGGYSRYNDTGAAARDYLEYTKTWTITDGGYLHVASSGATAGGIAKVSLTLSNVASGGVLANGTATIAETINIIASGGAISSRTSDRFLSTWNTSNTSAGSSTSTQIKLPLVNGGTYNFIINWGDGTTDTITTWNQAEVTHTYGASGAKTIEIIGTLIGWSFNYAGDRLKILTISDWGAIRLGNTSSYFSGCENLTSIGKFLDTTGTTDFSTAWYYCDFTSFPLIDTSNGTNFSYAWSNCSNLTSFPLVDTSNGIDFSGAWFVCSSLTSFPALDTSLGTNFSSTWNGCSNLTSFPTLNTSSGLDFGSAWNNCGVLSSFPTIDTSIGTNFNSAWSGCTSLTSFPALDTSSGLDFGSAWAWCQGLTSFSTIDTSLGTDFSYTWYNCILLSSFPTLNTSSGTNFTETWEWCTSLTSFPLINISSATSLSLTWAYCSGLTSFPAIDMSGVTSIDYTWVDCNSLTEFPVGFGSTMGAMTYGAGLLSNVTFTTVAYSRLLVEIRTVNANTTVTFDGGLSRYNDTGAVARDYLEYTKTWTITDGGYLHVASSGATAGGIAKIGLIVANIASGGVLAGSVSSIIATYNLSASGGALAGGVSQVNVTRSVIASSGALAGGIAKVGLTFSNIASGGALAGSTSLIKVTYNLIASGGALAGGVSQVNVTRSVIASSGVIAGGAIGINGSIFSQIASGGALAGGVSNVNLITSKIASGGVLCNGLSKIGLTFGNIASSGAIAGGLSKIGLTVAHIASSGAIAGGAIVINGSIVNETASGGIRISGVSISDSSTIQTSGGINCGGSAIVQKYSVNRIIGTGGIVVNGHGSMIDSINTSGGIAIGGIGKIRQIHRVISIGGAIASGTSILHPAIFNINSTNGSKVSGIAYTSYFGLGRIPISGGVLSSGLAKKFTLSSNISTGGCKVGFVQGIVYGSGGAKSNGLSKLKAIYKIVSTSGGKIGGTAAESQCISAIGNEDTKSPGAGISSSFIGYPLDTYTFSSVNNVVSSNDAWATAIMTLDPSTAGWLVCKNFGLDIPNGCIINGIRVRIERSSSRANRIKDVEVRILKNGLIVGTNKANTSLFWGTTDSIRTYGGLSDLWGTTWTKNELESSEFGIAIKVSKTNSGSNVAARVDHVDVTVSFTGGFSACLLSAPSSGGIRCGGVTNDDPGVYGGVVYSGYIEATGGIGVIISSLHPFGGIGGRGTSIVRTTFNTPSYNGGIWGGVKYGGLIFSETFLAPPISGGANVGGSSIYGDIIAAHGGIVSSGLNDNYTTILTRGGITSGGNAKTSILYRPKRSIDRTGVIFASEVFTSVTPGPPNFAYDELMSGGIRMTGDSISYTDRLISNKVPIIVGGSVTSLRILVIVPNSGSKISGTSNVQFTGNATSQKGIIVNGYGPIYENVIASGGIKISGLLRSNINYTKLQPISAGVRINGAALIKTSLNVNASNGIKINGLSTSFRLMQDTALGGSITNGKAQIIIDVTTSGGAVLNGIADCTINKIINASGGCKISSNNITTSNWYIRGIDGAKLSGNSKIVLVKKPRTISIKTIIDLLFSYNIYSFKFPEQELFQTRDSFTPDSFIPKNDEPRSGENEEWCEIDIRCPEGSVPSIVINRQLPIIPNNRIE